MSINGEVFQNSNLGRNLLIGGTVGSVLMGRPLLGALGGAAFTLVSQPEMTKGILELGQQMLGDASPVVREHLGQARSAVENLGRGLFGAEGPRPDEAKAREGAQGVEATLKLPGWAKWAMGAVGVGLAMSIFGGGLHGPFSTGWFGGYGTPGMDAYMTPGPFDGIGLGMAPTTRFGLSEVLTGAAVLFGANALLNRSGPKPA